ncbi:MAG: hypothetical protein KBI04_05455 [Paludibacteraceae bacterium]|nr:hypothetical protein [Paludibacteraceae bacterium]
MDRFKHVDDKLTEQLNAIIDLASDLSFEAKLTFELNETIDYTLLGNLNFSGIYLIEIKTDPQRNYKEWLTEFKNEWEKEEFKKSFVPNLKVKRTIKHNQLDSWFPLYLGKSKAISKRIKEHIDLSLTQPTTSLKLKARKNLYGCEFRVSVVRVNVSNYDLIMPQLETLLRNRINPILGRQ